ncbi:MAG: PEP-CTERM sorting domain-containing protein [Verrucomicrobiaceae bacterium]|nr:MAG: PEP-CTERM sorting domain-containing protein [Verrucomicrobiaceae bacterium]
MVWGMTPRSTALSSLADFHVFGSAVVGPFVAGSITRDDFTELPSGIFDNRQIYLIISNSADFSKASILGIFTKNPERGSGFFPGDTANYKGSIVISTLNYGAVTAVFGNAIDNATGADLLVPVEFSDVPDPGPVIPEPGSTALLTLAGGLILGRRRSRAL